MYTYSIDFLSALGAWQNGWGEDPVRRMEITQRLQSAISNASLPAEAFAAPDVCFRKRYLVPNNPQNGGDFWPFFWDGEIDEGVASWSLDYQYCKTIFKIDPRAGELACIFARKPARSEIVLNIAGLWGREDFSQQATSYIDSGGEHAAALNRFKDSQGEVVLNAPLLMDEVRGFCGKVPELEALCTAAGISRPSDEDDLWRRMVEKGLLPFDLYWLEDAAAQRAIDRALEVIQDRLRSLVKGT